MINLKDTTPIATGTNRACYIHPQDGQKCIKITISGNHKESNREIDYYKFLQKQNISWDMLAQFYGVIDTDMGDGEVVELIRDENGEISKSLDYYFRKSDVDMEFFIKKLLDMNRYLEKENIYIKDLNAVNIVYQKGTKNERLVIIDGLSHSNYIPFGRHFVKKKIQQSWEHLIYKLKKRCKTKYNPKLEKELKKWNL